MNYDKRFIKKPSSKWTPKFSDIPEMRRTYAQLQKAPSLMFLLLIDVSLLLLYMTIHTSTDNLLDSLAQRANSDPGCFKADTSEFQYQK